MEKRSVETNKKVNMKKDEKKEKPVRVILCDEEYVFKGESPEVIKEVAHMVNQEIEEIKHDYPNLGRNRILMLALMKMGEAIFKLKKENEELLDFFTREE